MKRTTTTLRKTNTARLLAGLLLAGAAQLAVAAGSGSISGTVHYQGAPAAGARLVVIHDTVSQYTGSTYADSNGQYHLASVPLGDVRVRVYNTVDQRLGEQAATLSTPDAVVSVDIAIN